MDDTTDIGNNLLNHVWDFSVRLGNLPESRSDGEKVTHLIHPDSVLHLAKRLVLVNGVEMLSEQVPSEPLALKRVQSALSGPYGDVSLSRDFEALTKKLLKSARDSIGHPFVINDHLYDAIYSIRNRLQEFVRTAASASEGKRLSEWAARFRDLIKNLNTLHSYFKTCATIDGETSRAAILICSPPGMASDEEYQKAGVLVSGNLHQCHVGWSRESRWRCVGNDGLIMKCIKDLMRITTGVARWNSPHRSRMNPGLFHAESELARQLRERIDDLHKLVAPENESVTGETPDRTLKKPKPAKTKNVDGKRKYPQLETVIVEGDEQGWGNKKILNVYRQRYAKSISKGTAPKVPDPRKVTSVRAEMKRRCNRRQSSQT